MKKITIVEGEPMILVTSEKRGTVEKQVTQKLPEEECGWLRAYIRGGFGICEELHEKHDLRSTLDL